MVTGLNCNFLQLDVEDILLLPSLLLLPWLTSSVCGSMLLLAASHMLAAGAGVLQLLSTSRSMGVRGGQPDW
jgi:hypothetical protein